MIVDGKVVFPHLCPVCKKHLFTEPFEYCPICHWTFDITQEENPDWGGCANFMSFNEAKRAYAAGEEIY
ncbi:MAG: hypothetical protein IJN48_03700 [Clostridia bacterium]|nr:hypothetical protein [Clostridia bacterium]